MVGLCLCEVFYCYLSKKTKYHFSAKFFFDLISGIWVEVNEDCYRDQLWFMLSGFYQFLYSLVVFLLTFYHTASLQRVLLSNLYILRNKKIVEKLG